MRIVIALVLLATVFAGCTKEGTPQFPDPVAPPVTDDPGTFPSTTSRAPIPTALPQNTTAPNSTEETGGNGTEPATNNTAPSGNETASNETEPSSLKVVYTFHNATHTPPRANFTLDAINPNGNLFFWKVEIEGNSDRTGDSRDRPPFQPWPRELVIDFPEAGQTYPVKITYWNDDEMAVLETEIVIPPVS